VAWFFENLLGQEGRGGLVFFENLLGQEGRGGLVENLLGHDGRGGLDPMRTQEQT
jgi:hypothetical protein